MALDADELFPLPALGWWAIIRCTHQYQHSIFDRNLRFITGTMRCEAGYFYLPDGPGLGVEPAGAVFDYGMDDSGMR